MSVKHLSLPIVAILGLTVLASCTSSQSSTSTTTPTSSTTTTSSTLSKSATYTTDHGKHQVGVTFSITKSGDDTITALSTTMDSGDHESQEYIDRFDSAAKSKIVGKKISELSGLSTVGGASDTTSAFTSIITHPS